jgi:hypothetical protein
VSTCQHRTKLCCKCSILLVSSLKLSPRCWWRDSTLPGSPGFNFTRASCVISL